MDRARIENWDGSEAVEQKVKMSGKGVKTETKPPVIILAFFLDPSLLPQHFVF